MYSWYSLEVSVEEAYMIAVQWASSDCVADNRVWI